MSPPPLSQRTRRPPKEMVPLKPQEFAAQLISRLESLKRQQDTLSCLEERLQQIQEVRTTVAPTNGSFALNSGLSSELKNPL